MADFRIFRTRFWTDPYTLSLTCAEAHLFAWLFTNPHVNQIGAIDVSDLVILLETHLDPGELPRILKKFADDGKIRRFGAVIWVVNFHKHQSTRSPSLRQRIKKDLEAMGPSNPLVQAFLERYPDIQEEEPRAREEKIEEDEKRRKEREKRREEIGTVSHGVHTVPTPSPKNTHSLSDADVSFKEFWEGYPIKGRHLKEECRTIFNTLVEDGKFEDFRAGANGYSYYLKDRFEKDHFEQEPMFAKKFLLGGYREYIRYPHKAPL